MSLVMMLVLIKGMKMVKFPEMIMMYKETPSGGMEVMGLWKTPDLGASASNSLGTDMGHPKPV